jgi:predicted NBD/HSP70 family sugar kinase
MPKTDYRTLILGHLFASGVATRTEIAERLGIRKSTVGEVCRGLLAEGRLQGGGGTTRNARLRLATDAFLALGVEHRLDCLKLVVLDASLQRKAQASLRMPPVYEEARVAAIVERIRGFLREQGLDRAKPLGLGFSDFIPHDIGTGAQFKSIWMPGWGSINIKAKVGQALGLETRILRCTDAYSLAERAFGSCRAAGSFIVVQLDEGIGLSVYHQGSFLRGTTDIFGELGHTVYNEDGEICKCGNRGCLETIAGLGAVTRKVQDNVDRSYFHVQDGGASITFQDVVHNAREGNKLALLALNEAAKAIGNTLANVVNVLGITRIILYGRLVLAGDLLRQQLLNSIRQHCIYPLNQDTEVCLSQLDDFASAAGAAYSVLQGYFERTAAG